MLESGLVNRVFQHHRTQSPDGSRINLDDPPSPTQKWALTPESFNSLLVWLNHDREQAGAKYEEIRDALIKRFRHLGCLQPEELADETFDRVTRKLPEILSKFKGDPEPYVFAVAYYIYKEHRRKPVLMSLANSDFRLPNLLTSEEMFEKEILDDCLKQCMDHLTNTNREMILEYYRGERQVKIRTRKALAERLGIGLAALRLKAQRVRTTLKKCILDCMERKAMQSEALM